MKNKTNFLLRLLILGYFVLAITLFTLNPILLNQLKYSPEWVWKLSVTDFAQNILLFIPFGIAYRHSYRHNHIQGLLYGILLSGCIESCQLFIEWRSSNFFDIFSNGFGALIGSYFHQYAFSRSKPLAFEIPLACMYVPLGWVSTIRSLWEIPTMGAVFLGTLASLSLIQSTFRQTNHPQKIGIAVLWISLFLLPIINTSPKTGLAAISITPGLIALSLVAGGNTTILKRMVLATTAMGCMLILVINSDWYFTHGITSWSNNEHLRLSELLLSTATMFGSITWSRKSN